MPNYRIISEVDTRAEHRLPRGVRPEGDQLRQTTVVQANSLIEAAELGALDHERRRIISIEETYPGIVVDDEEITAALTAGEIDVDAYAEDTEPLYGRLGFTTLVRDVVEGLRESGLVPGLNISVLDNEVDEPYAMLEIYDDARDAYLSRGTELRRLTDDRDAVGWDGVLAVARAIIAFTDPLH